MDPREAGHGAYAVTIDRTERSKEKEQRGPDHPVTRETRGGFPGVRKNLQRHGNEQNQGPGVLLEEVWLLHSRPRGTVCSYWDEHL